MIIGFNLRRRSPNGPDLPAWPAYDLETKRHQVLDVKISQGENDRKDELDLMDIYAGHLP